MGDFEQKSTSSAANQVNNKKGLRSVFKFEILKLRDAFSLKERITCSKGFTLIELMAVIVIMGIIATISVPSVMGTIEKAKKDVLEINLYQFEKMYEKHLVMEGIEHSELIFEQYVESYGEDPCFDNTKVAYSDGKAVCDGGLNEDSEVESDVGEDANDNNDSGVPYL